MELDKVSAIFKGKDWRELIFSNTFINRGGL